MSSFLGHRTKSVLPKIYSVALIIKLALKQQQTWIRLLLLVCQSARLGGCNYTISRNLNSILVKM